MVKITDVWMKDLLYHALNLSDHYHFDMVLYKDPGCPLCLLIASSWEQIASFSSLSELLGVCTKGKCLYFQCWNQLIKVIWICNVKDSALKENFKVLNIACYVCAYGYVCVWCNLYSVGSPAVAVVKGQLFTLLQDVQLSQEGLRTVCLCPALQLRTILAETLC
jgi:hypothetical protein